MNPRIMINGIPVTDKLGEGLEADVWRVEIKGKPVAVKIIRQPDHPTFAHDPAMREAARTRVAQMQEKLPVFRTDIPKQIIRPRSLIRDKDMVIGFTMDLLPDGSLSAELLSGVSTRSKHGVTNAELIPHLIELCQVVSDTHAVEVLLGDVLSMNNVHFHLTHGVRLIDGDSIIWGDFTNNTHTRLTVDPLLCNADLIMNKPHSKAGDNYALAVLITTLLLQVHPFFDGIYTPDDEMSDEERVAGRISIFHRDSNGQSDIELPDTATDPAYLPEELREHLRKVFEEDYRGAFPIDLLKNLVWTVCSCGVQHGLTKCPSCGNYPSGSGATRQGQAEVTNLFTAPDGTRIVGTAFQKGELRYAYAVGNDIHRDGTVVLTDAYPGPDAKVLLSRGLTAVVNNNDLTAYNADGTQMFTANNVADGGNTTAFNSTHVYWITSSNDVMRDDASGMPRRLGRIAGPPSQIWVGEEFGVAFWKEVMATVTIFDQERPGLRSFTLPPAPGNLVDVHCIISSSVAWLLLTLERAGKHYRYCYAINGEGYVLASYEAEAGTEAWLDAPLGLHAATGTALFTPTSDGLVRVDLDRDGAGYEIIVRDAHTSSAPFVQDATRILVGKGMIVQSGNDINRLTNRTN